MVFQRIAKYHRLRKQKEVLPEWKEKWNSFNEYYLGWLEHGVDKFIPWLVLLLLFLIIGEFSHNINIFHWHWLDVVAEFFEANYQDAALIDQFVIGFFVVDLYFNFFKKATVWKFIKTSFLDILAVAPVGLFLRIAGVGEAQSVLHVTAEIEKEASRFAREVEVATKVAREAEIAAKFRRTTRSTRILRILPRIPRFIRLYRLGDFFRKKKLK